MKMTKKGIDRLMWGGFAAIMLLTVGFSHYVRLDTSAPEAGAAGSNAGNLRVNAERLKEGVKPGPFDGRKLYAEAFDLIIERHLGLAEITIREEWAGEWKNRFDGKKVRDASGFALPGWEGKFDDVLILDNETTVDHAIELMLLSVHYLHDSYMRPADTKEMQQIQDPSFAGIGVKVALKGQLEAIQTAERTRPATDDRAVLKAWYEQSLKPVLDQFATISDEHPLVVMEPPEDGTPALDSGLKIGDEILSVAEEGKEPLKLSGMKLKEAVEKMRGPIDTDVNLLVRRLDSSNGAASPFERVLTAKRGHVIPKVVAYDNLDDCVSLIRLKDFVSKYGRVEFKNALERAVGTAEPCTDNGKPAGVVIDLRDNHGGNIDLAYAIESTLMDTGLASVIRNRTESGFKSVAFNLMPDYVIQSVSYSDQVAPPAADAFARRPFSEEEPGVFSQRFFSKVVLPTDFKLVVVINSGSASASELLSGSLQGSGRATIIGTSSFGKGVGQSSFPLMNGGIDEKGRAVRILHLTTFEFRPANKDIDNVGIIPDIYVEYAPAPEGKKWIWDSQITAAKAEILRQMHAAEDAALHRRTAADKRTAEHKRLLGEKMRLIETGKSGEGELE